MQRRLAWMGGVLSLSLLAAGCRDPDPVAPAPVPPPAASAPHATAPRAEDAAAPRDATHPALDIVTVDGKSFSLAQQRGQWVVVNIWATWCSPCLKEMPDLSALDALREHVSVIGLAYEDIAAEDMRAFLEEHPVVYPIAIIDMNNPPADFDSPRGLPVTYLIAPDGRVAERFLGPVTAVQLETAIAAAGGPALPTTPATAASAEGASS